VYMRRESLPHVVQLLGELLDGLCQQANVPGRRLLDERAAEKRDLDFFAQAAVQIEMRHDSNTQTRRK